MTEKDKKKLVSWSVFLSLGITLFLFASFYYKQLIFYNKTVNSRNELLSLYKKQVTNKPRLQKELERMKAIVRDSNLFVITKSAEEASNDLLQKGQEIIKNSQGEITTTRVIKTPPDSKVVSVSYNFTISNENFVTLLQEVAASRPLVNISFAKVRAERIRKSVGRKNRKAIIQNINTGKLLVQITLESYLAIDDSLSQVGK